MTVQAGDDKAGPGWGQWRWGHEARFWRHSPGEADRCTREKKRHPTQRHEFTAHRWTVHFNTVKTVNFMLRVDYHRKKNCN